MSNFFDVTLTVKHLAPSRMDELKDFIFEELDGDLSRSLYGTPDMNEDGDPCFCCHEPINWGVKNREMKILSERFPEALFVVWQRDECYEEFRGYWQNGRAAFYEPIITWPEFNPNDLHEMKPLEVK